MPSKRVLLKTKNDAWNPYFAGALVGVLAMAAAVVTSSLLGSTKYIGASTTYVRASGFILKTIFPAYVDSNAYYAKLGLKIDWEFMIVIGIVIGAGISSITGKSFKIENLPVLWKNRFGPSVAKRALAAFFGAVVTLIGTRLADGCPSGNGLSGMMQLSASGFAFFITFFITAVIVARIVYGGKPR